MPNIHTCKFKMTVKHQRSFLSVSQVYGYCCEQGMCDSSMLKFKYFPSNSKILTYNFCVDSP